MSDSGKVSATHYRACHLCEAICGIAVEHDGQQILGIRPDPEDVFSRGHICPKGVALADLHADPDRLRKPLRRRGRDWEEIDWETAYTEVTARLQDIRRRHGRHSVAFYQGNPTVHNYGSLLYGAFVLPEILRTKNRYSATSVDQLPRMLVSYLLYGHQAMLPVPDLDRTAYLLILGANPLVSNGSLMTAPDVGQRLKDIRRRGGKIVVVDPRRTETAAQADEHHFIRPGRDALFLLGLLYTLFAENLVNPGRLAQHTSGLDEVRRIAAAYSPQRVQSATGIPAEDIIRLAREFAAAPSAACYGRMGVSVQEFGALSTWLIDCLNLLTGNLDRPGGWMFTNPAVDLVGLAARTGQKGSFDRYRSRVRGLPEFSGEFPSSTLSDEIETPGEGQVRALITSCGNPVLSTPNGSRLERALQTLDLVVAIDIYKNETTRHAHYILPPTFGLEHEHYDLALFMLSIRNTTRFSPALFPPAEGQPHDWQIFLELSARLKGGWKGKLLRAGGRLFTPRRLVDLLLRLGPYGDRFNPFSKGLNLKRVEAAPHGIDLGPLQPCLPGRLFTKSRRIELAHPALLQDIDRLEARFSQEQSAASASGSLTLISRRQLRSNNSWLHNSERLVRGRRRCTLLMHPLDAASLKLQDAQQVEITARTGQIAAELEISDEVMPGIVCMPHGWGHDREGIGLSVASRHPGSSINDLTDEQFLDQLSGNASLSGVSVQVRVLTAAERAEPMASAVV